LDKKLLLYKDLIENNITEKLNGKSDFPLYDAMNYSMFPGGKRLRGLIILAVCEAFAGTCVCDSCSWEACSCDIDEFKSAVNFASAIEMIHTYTLIHDDLPAVDNDDYRRGKKSTHIVYGEAVGIFAGDALLTKAFEIMLKDSLEDFNKNKLECMYNISKAVGADGLLEGQVIDVLSEGKNLDFEILKILQEKKTSELIRVSFETGALIGHCDKNKLKDINIMGKLIGDLFQLKDDILDVTSTKEELGKNINSDIENKKLTYVTKFGLEKSSEMYEEKSREVLSRAENIFKKSDFIFFLIDKIINRKN